MANTGAGSGKLDLNELRAQGPEAFHRRFSEADIAQIEKEDLTDPWIVSMLASAYRQNDPEEREIVGIRREPSIWGTKSELTEAVAEAEATLKERPNDFWARYTRLRALTGLAYRRKSEASTGRARQRHAG